MAVITHLKKKMFVVKSHLNDNTDNTSTLSGDCYFSRCALLLTLL